MSTWGCTASVDMASMFREFGDYERNLRAVSTDPRAVEVLEVGKTKHVEAEALVDQGKKKEAIPMVEQALANAELALELEKMSAAEGCTEKCRAATEQARIKWLQAFHALNQTEEFVGMKPSTSMPEVEPPREPPRGVSPRA